MLVFGLLVGCGNNNANGSSKEQKPIIEYQQAPALAGCEVGADPFVCQKMACLTAGGLYDQNTKVCNCENNKMFYARNGGQCIHGQEFNKGIMYKWADRNSMPLQILGAKLDEVKLILPTLSPLIGSLGRFVLFNSVSDYNNVNSGFADSLFTITVDAPNLNLEFNPNSAVHSAIVPMEMVSFFLSNEKEIDIADQSLSDLLKVALVKSEKFEPTDVISYSDLGCAEICEANQEIILENDYVVIHRKVYSGGNPINDILLFYNRQTNHFDLKVALFNHKISHYVIRNPDLGYQTFANTGELISTNKIAIENENKRMKETADSYQVPVLIFESGIPQQVDKVVAVGPNINSSYYGWFVAEDRMSFLNEYSNAGNSNHAGIVTSLASDDYKRLLLPMPMNSIYNGDLLKVVPRFPFKHVVGNLSLATVFAGSQRTKNRFAKLVSQTVDKILWVQGAGNTGNELVHQAQEIQSQSLSGKENFIVVAATNGTDQLAYTSSYSKVLVDIAASGCPAGPEPCIGAGVGTSFAAPRVSRASANLMEEFPEASPNQIKLALMLGAHVPDKPLAVRCGGIIDEFASKKLLQLMRQKGAQSLATISKDELVEMVLMAKYFDLSDDQRSDANLRKKTIKQISWIFKK